MKTIKGFVKKYWITVLIFAGLVLLYYYVADVKMLNPYLFPTTEKIAAAFESNKEVMLTNMLASFKYSSHQYFFLSDCSYIWYNHGIK